MTRILRTLYFAALIVWVAYSILLPPWIGRIYNRDLHDPEDWQESGTFGLRGANGWTMRAPLWNPPRPHSAAILAAVRWPWQSVDQHDHVELEVAGLTSQITLSVLALGVLLRIGHGVVAPGEPDTVVRVAWSLSLSLIIAWLSLLAIGIFTMGFGLTEPVVVTVLLLGVLGGLLYGLSASRWLKTGRRHRAVRRP